MEVRVIRLSVITQITRSSSMPATTKAFVTRPRILSACVRHHRIRLLSRILLRHILVRFRGGMATCIASHWMNCLDS